MRRGRRYLMLLLVFGLLGARSRVVAAELVMRDLSLNLQYLVESYEFSIDDGESERSGSDAFDGGFAVCLSGRYSLPRAGRAHGWIVGGDIGYASRSGDDLELETYGLTAVGGYAYALSDRWHTAVELSLGWGLGELTVDGGGLFADASGDGDWFGYGIDGVVGYALSDHWLVDLRAGYGGRQGTYGMDGFDTEFDTAGVRAALGITWRLSLTPRSLE